uniref:Uncharacterized protein n=1 Tax=Solanum tuberosum TaxID=4113 RepID=M1DJ76_SOLTU
MQEAKRVKVAKDDKMELQKANKGDDQRLAQREKQTRMDCKIMVKHLKPRSRKSCFRQICKLFIYGESFDHHRLHNHHRG